jgi:hypothetical protein
VCGEEGAIRSGDDVVDDGPVDIGETVIATGVAVGEPLVIEAHEMEDRGVEIVGVNRLHDRTQPVLVGGTVDDAPLGATAGQP